MKYSGQVRVWRFYMGWRVVAIYVLRKRNKTIRKKKKAVSKNHMYINSIIILNCFVFVVIMLCVCCFLWSSCCVCLICLVLSGMYRSNVNIDNNIDGLTYSYILSKHLKLIRRCKTKHTK